MNDDGGWIAAASVLLSSMALVAVAVSLVLQQRQLRISQLQTSRMAQFELVKVAIEYPELYVDPSDKVILNTDTYPHDAYTNLLLKWMELNYSINAMSRAGVHLQAASLFASAHRRQWWQTIARDVYLAEASNKREREFARIVDEEFRRAMPQQPPPESQGTISI